MVLSSANLPGWCNPEAVYVALDQMLDVRPAWSKDALCREPAYADVNFFPWQNSPKASDRAKAV